MGFSDPVLAGDTLVRSAISSPNYVQGVSGWTVTDQGTGEFADINIRGPNGAAGRRIHGWLSGTTPVLDFQPPTPATTGWSVDAGSVYTYNDGSGHEVLGLSSPQQYQPTATGQALIDMKSGSNTDAPQIVLTAPEVIIDGAATITGTLNVGGGTAMPLIQGQSGIELVSMGGSNGYHVVTFPTAFPINVVPMVFVNVQHDDNPAASGSTARACRITRTGFQLYVESFSNTALNWTNEPVGWLAINP